jgi:hypothetical protein
MTFSVKDEIKGEFGIILRIDAKTRPIYSLKSHLTTTRYFFTMLKGYYLSFLISDADCIEI